MENSVENKANKPSIFKRAKNKAVAYAGLASLALFSAPASADSVEVNSAFADLYKTVRDAMQGTVGALISLSLVLCGGFIAVKTQSFWAFILGVVMAIGFYLTPTIIETIMPNAYTGAQ